MSKMILIDEATVKLAQEKLTLIANGEDFGKLTPLIAAFAKALAEQPAQQEPVAWGIIASNTGRICQVELDADEVEGHNPKHIVPLYITPQPPAQPLTDEVIAALWSWSQSAQAEAIANTQQHAFARAIEAAHGITKGNT